MAAAKEVFARKGFHATTIADIAKQAGLAYGSVYWYFDSKDELFHALMAAEESALRTHVAAALAASGGENVRARGVASGRCAGDVGVLRVRQGHRQAVAPRRLLRWASDSKSISAASTSGSSTTSKPSSSPPRSAARW